MWAVFCLSSCKNTFDPVKNLIELLKLTKIFTDYPQCPCRHWRRRARGWPCRDHSHRSPSKDDSKCHWERFYLKVSLWGSVWWAAGRVGTRVSWSGGVRPRSARPSRRGCPRRPCRTAGCRGSTLWRCHPRTCSAGSTRAARTLACLQQETLR